MQHTGDMLHRLTFFMRQPKAAVSHSSKFRLRIMKALSIRQPWAWAIAHAGKDIENRSWHMRYRGALAIHASKRMTKCDYQAFIHYWNAGLGEASTSHFQNDVLPPVEELIRGAVIARAEAVDCVHESSSRWFAGPHGLLLQNPRVLQEPLYCRGRLGFFDLPDELSKLIEAQI